MQVAVYSLGPNCQGCRATERHLTKIEVDYVVHRLDQGAVLPDGVVAAQAPVVVYGESYHSGYRPGLLDALA
jgi:glutaredoxin-like protein NrdH